MIDLKVEVDDINRTSSTVKITQDKAFYAQATRRADAYKSLPYKMRPALERIADYVRVEMIPRTFEQEGPGWAPLARRTQRQRLWLGYDPQHPILIRTRDLFKELTEKSHPKHIEIIRTGKNARIEIGGSSKKFIENQLGIGGVPARPMIPGTGGLEVEERDRRVMEDIIKRTVKEITR